MQTGNSKKSHRYVNEEEGEEDKEEDTIPRITQDMGRFGAHPTSISSGNLPVFSILQILFLRQSRQVTIILPVLKSIILHTKNCVRLMLLWTIPM